MSPISVFHQRRVPCTADALAVAAALFGSSAGESMVYENRDEVGWGETPYATASARIGGTTLTIGGHAAEYPDGSAPLDALQQALAAVAVADWRAYGWLAFELGLALHGSQPLPAGTPLAHLVVPRREIRFTGGEALLRALDPDDLDVLELRLADAAAATAARPQPTARAAADVQDHGADEYRAAVASAVAEIRAGHLDKVILSRPVPVPEPIDFAATYVAGRRGNAPARSFLLDLGGWQAAGFCPEIVTTVAPDGTVTTQPLAGTRALDGDPAADRARRDELYRDTKEVYEHVISVRLAQEELVGVCEPGSVRVDDFMAVKERGSVQHLASELSGRLAAARSTWDAVAALFPAVTASGIPKAASCDLIHRAESEPRGLYSGSVLTLDSDGSLDAALVLRSVFRRGGRTWLRAGAGIVADSTPERELEETREKLRSVSRFLVPAALPDARPSVPSPAAPALAGN
ncbi:salicylate synthase [Yinghuangia soli]|uniref:Salicylate synthase n=1 Tax=Yinghuangia soli TaxID=2908204 RepID=A0AA41U951_9ACTN|nr:salicylate synthase [Yinghuangia soli]MCF2533534.1 salicylate synthase [Yinghuangia soli]